MGKLVKGVLGEWGRADLMTVFLYEEVVWEWFMEVDELVTEGWIGGGVVDEARCLATSA